MDKTEPRRIIECRDTVETAPARCVAFAAWSELTASPHDLDPRPALREKIGGPAALLYGAGLDELLVEFVQVDFAELKTEYSGLFEVGSEGPPVPIREDLQTGQRAGTREELVRFYDYFGYTLDGKFAWAPDHLSVELEFMHLLCYREASAPDNAISFQLAQADFTERHLQRWLPTLAGNAATVTGGSLYSRVLKALQVFVEKDFRWQNSTISMTEVPLGCFRRDVRENHD